MLKYLFLLTAVFLLCQARITDLKSQRKGRMIGGRDAAEGEAPYQVSLKENNFHFCGGSILTSRTILTAAHCVPSKINNITITVGTNKLYTGGDKYDVEKVIIHPEYTHLIDDEFLFRKDYFKAIVHHDIALVITKHPIKFTDLIKPIPIEPDYIGEGVNVTLTGWGYVRLSKFIVPSNLQILNLKTIPLNICKRKMRHEYPVYEHDICMFTKRGEGSCNGDSGGPLVANGKQVGIVSRGTSLCAFGHPDVNTRTSSFVDWIKRNTVE